MFPSALALLLAMALPSAGWAARTRSPAQNPSAGGPPPSLTEDFGDEEDFEEPPRGNAPSGNPFATATPPKGGGKTSAPPADELSEEDYDELSDDALRAKMEERLRQKATASGAPADYPPARPASSSTSTSPSTGTAATPISMGGDAAAGGTSRGQGCLKLDPDTGYGPDVVTNFDFPDADIVEIAKTLGKLTCLNFILDKEVRGRISIVSNSPITIGDAWKAFLTALDVNQFTIIPSGKYLRIAKQRDAKDKQLKIYSGAYAPDHDAMITRVVPLKYINAEEVRRVFMNITAPTTRMMSYEQTNTLIITDTAANIKKLTDLISLLDIEGFDEGLEVIKIKYASADDIAKLVDQLLPGPGSAVGGPGAPAGMPRFGGKGFASRKTKEGGIISHIISDGRTNSLIVNANAKGFEQVKILIKKLDTRVSLSQGGSRIHVMYLQFADAEQVANTMNNLASGAGNPGAKSGMPGVSPAQAALFEGAVKVAADKPTNSLVVTASATDYMLVKRVISKLDVPRDQVYVEVAIMEMNMDKAFSMSTSVVSPKNGLGFLPNSDLSSFLTNPLTGVQGLALGFKHGSSVNFTPPGGSSPIAISTIQGLITALQQNGNSNLLATPQILTLDNQEASIEIGESVPVPTVTAVQGAGTAQSFTREKVSLSLNIKPQINKISNFVKLEIKQKFQDFENRSVPKALQDQAFGTTERSSQTIIVVQDQDTVALGGLMRDKVSESATKVPILGDIPVLGWLFRASSKRTIKTNLVMFITPRIIKQYQNIRGILDKKLKERDEFIETANGGNDPYERQKLEMIRGLPPLSELKNTYKVENTDALEEDAEEEEQEPSGDGQVPSAYRQNQSGVSLPPSLQGLPTGGMNTAGVTPTDSQPAPAPQGYTGEAVGAPVNPGIAPQQTAPQQ